MKDGYQVADLKESCQRILGKLKALGLVYEQIDLKEDDDPMARLVGMSAWQIKDFCKDLSEKMVLKWGEESTDPEEILEYTDECVKEWKEAHPGDPVGQAAQGEEELQQLVANVMKSGVSPGMENLLEKIADESEGNSFCLKRKKEKGKKK